LFSGSVQEGRHHLGRLPKHINWPAKVTAYYPKERKVSYVFFPLVPKNNVFKADPAKVQLFTLDDQLPENAKPDLEECFEQARRVLQGVPEEEIIAENAQKAEETPVQAKPKKKALTTADALKKSVATPKSTPKRQPKAAILAEKAANFTQGDPIIVDTPMGMWPGMVGI
uniref:PWWP domain-containing protein n=1 Tax=Globodera pallida TaxID=36090 RepID=A0A183CSK6_GLOPA